MPTRILKTFVLVSFAVAFSPGLALADNALVMGATGTPTPNEAELVASTYYLDASGFKPTGPDPVVALTTPEASSNNSYLVGEQDLFNTVEADWHTGQITAADPLYVFGYSQSATIASAVMPEFASGTGVNATADHTYAPGSGDVIPSNDLHFVFIGNPASDPDGIGGHAGVDGYMNVYGNWAALGGYPSIDGVKTPDNLYPVDSFATQTDNWAIATNPLNLNPSDHLDYYGLPYQMSIPQLLADATETHTGLATYFDIPDTFINQSLAQWDALLVSWDIIP